MEYLGENNKFVPIYLVNDNSFFPADISRLLQVLIENSSQIGVVPECLYEHLSSWTPSCSITSHDELEISRNREKKKKRRSGSLTSMLFVFD